MLIRRYPFFLYQNAALWWQCPKQTNQLWLSAQSRTPTTSAAFHCKHATAKWKWEPHYCKDISVLGEMIKWKEQLSSNVTWTCQSKQVWGLSCTPRNPNKIGDASKKVKLSMQTSERTKNPHHNCTICKKVYCPLIHKQSNRAKPIALQKYSSQLIGILVISNNVQNQKDATQGQRKATNNINGEGWGQRMPFGIPLQATATKQAQTTEKTFRCIFPKINQKPIFGWCGGRW